MTEDLGAYFRFDPGPGYDDKTWLESRHAEGAWFPLERPFRATEARVTAVRIGEKGFRARLELGATSDAALLLPSSP